MSPWLSNLLLGSTGLLLSSVVTSFVLRAWRARPVPAYRLAVAVLAAGLFLPAAQLLARAFGAPLAHPVTEWVDGLRAGEPEDALLAPPALAAVDQEPEVLRSASMDPALLALLLLGQERERVQLAPTRLAGEPAGADPIRWTWILAWLYALGALASLAGTARRLLATRRLLCAAREVSSPRTLAVWREVAGRSPAGERARLLESPLLRAPACCGLGRQAVILPSPDALEQRPEMLACVITHELVHLERRDAWVQLGEELLRALFWFHPAAWWLIARLERLREASCDQLVVRRTGKRRRYASALIEYAAWMQAGALGSGHRAGQAAAVLPWSTSKGQLARRIEMLLNNEPSSSPVKRFAGPTAVGILFTFLWSGQLALAACSAPGSKHCDEPHAKAEHRCDAKHAGDGCEQEHVVCVEPDGHARVIQVSPEGKVVTTVVASEGAAPKAGVCAVEVAQVAPIPATPEGKGVDKMVEPKICSVPAGVAAIAVEGSDPVVVVEPAEGVHPSLAAAATPLAPGVYYHDPKSGELRSAKAGKAHAIHADGHAKGSKHKGKRRVFVLDEETGKLTEVGAQGEGAGEGADAKVKVELQQLEHLKELGAHMRAQADQYYRMVEPEKFAADLERAMESLDSAAACGAIGDEIKQKVEAYRELLQKGEHKKALEKAHKALKQLSDVDLARKLSEANLAGAHAGMAGTLGRLGTAGQLKTKKRSSSAEASEIDALRRELEETRALLNDQRSELEQLRKELEQLSSKPDPGAVR